MQPEAELRHMSSGLVYGNQKLSANGKGAEQQESYDGQRDFDRHSRAVRLT